MPSYDHHPTRKNHHHAQRNCSTPHHQSIVALPHHPRSSVFLQGNRVSARGGSGTRPPNSVKVDVLAEICIGRSWSDLRGMPLLPRLYVVVMLMRSLARLLLKHSLLGNAPRDDGRSLFRNGSFGYATGSDQRAVRRHLTRNGSGGDGGVEDYRMADTIKGRAKIQKTKGNVRRYRSIEGEIMINRGSTMISRAKI